MQRMKVMTIIGTRPEIIRLSRVMAKLDQYADHVIVHTGQNYDYELNEIFFEDLGIRRPDRFLEAAGSSPAETIGNVLIAADRVMEEEKPEALLVLGDTNSCLAVIAAKRRRIPIFHMEAGNRCFDERVPEEINRRIVDHTADINLPYSDIAREYLLREGIAPDRIIKTGSPMAEILAHYQEKIASSRILEELGVSERKFVLVSAHREENIDDEVNFRVFLAMLAQVAEKFGEPVLVSTHPRTRKRIDQAGIELSGLVRFMKPFGYFDYNKLQMEARVVLSDSGTISEESSILNFPALNIRQAHERPEAMEEGAVMMTGLAIDRVLQGLEILADQQRGATRTLGPVGAYDVPNVSDKVLRIILSYSDYVQRVVWKSF
jgi:UDP-N-acetylglucosamine 2-epimerase (non-hydrolysing)